jgi:TolB-like protein/tetratricopeptide (TPR) repeat protein
VNLSDDAEQEYFSDGLAEELLNLLSRIPDLRVISRSSAFSFKGKDITVPEIARQLNVAHVLEGSVRRSGEQLRITVQLIEAKSDTHLWAETYDREFADVFTVQEDIAWAITGALKSQLGTGVADGQLERPVLVPAANTAAYDAFLRGRELMRARGGENLQHAVEEFERALRLDEHFAPAHALLSIAHLLGVDWGELDTEDAIPTAVAHLDRASQLQPDLPEVLAGQALLASVLNEPASAIEHAGKALAVNPNDAFVMNMLQIFLADMGRYDESFAVAGRMMVIDPLSPIGRLNYCWLLGDRGRLAEARTIANQMLEEKLSLGYLAHAILSIWYEGELADGLSWVLRWGSDNIWVVYTFSLIREPDEARRVSERLAFYSDWYEQNWDEAIEATQQILANNPNSHWAYRNAADSYYFAHRFEEALPLFERSLDFVPKDRPIKQPHRLDRTVAAAVSRRMAGDDLGAEELIEIAEKDLAARRSAGIDSQLLYWAEAMIAAFGGETERALAALDASIEWGLRDWLIFEDPVFDALRENTRFVGLQQKLDDILAQEREKVLRLICLENPVPDDWRPLPD